MLLKATQKPNIFDIKPVTIEQPKASTKLAKPIKQTKIISQRPERTENPNFYTQIVFDDINVDKLLDRRHDDCSIRVENWTHEDSGWIVYLIIEQKSFLVKEVYISHYLKN